MKKKVLAIAIHPDDETLGCGGSLLKHIANGDEVHWLIVTKANQNRTDVPDINLKQKAFIEEVATKYNFCSWKQFDFVSTELDRYPLNELISEFSRVINEIEPHVLYFNHYADVHSDHRIAFNAIYSCTKNFRYPFIEKILLFETLSETEFAAPLIENAFVPNYFNDISHFFNKKVEIMNLFKTEVMPSPLPRSITAIEALARYRGSRIGVEFAEAFMLLYEKA